MTQKGVILLSAESDWLKWSHDNATRKETPG